MYSMDTVGSTLNFPSDASEIMLASHSSGNHYSNRMDYTVTITTMNSGQPRVSQDDVMTLMTSCLKLLRAMWQCKRRFPLLLQTRIPGRGTTTNIDTYVCVLNSSETLLFPQAIPEWNSLPDPCVEMDTVDAFSFSASPPPPSTHHADMSCLCC